MTILNRLPRAPQSLRSCPRGALSGLGRPGAGLGRHARALFGPTGLCLVALALASCGGGNPLGNPPLVVNPPGVSGQKLSFAYYQKCINRIFETPITQGGSTNTCAGSGCHDNTSGTGGAFRVIRAATDANLADTPDVIRTSDMYKNFYSAQGEVVIGSATQSRLLAKPLLLNVLHGGGLIFASDQDSNAKQIRYWISNAVADEFGTAASSLFTSAGDCVPQ